MAITIDSRKRHNFGDQDMVFMRITLDSSYPTGGYQVNASDFGLSSMEGFTVVDTIVDGYVLAVDHLTNKLVVYVSGAAGAVLQQLAAGTDLSSVRLALKGFSQS